MKGHEGNEWMYECRSEGENEPTTNNTIIPGMGLSIFIGNQEPPGLPQEAHVMDPLPLEKRVINIGISIYPLKPPLL
jgi:hypothetical protein